MKTGADTEAPAESDRTMGEYRGRSEAGTPGSADSVRRAPDARARSRAMARRRRRRRQRRILIGIMILILVLVAGGIFLGVSGHKKKKAREAVLQEGIAAMESGDLDGAIVKFDEALTDAKGKIGKFETDVLQRRGDAEYQKGDYEAAKHTFELLKEDKSQEEYQRMLALCEAKLGNYDAALAYKVCDAWVYNQMALTEIKNKDYDAALGHIEQGIAVGDETVMQDLSYNQAVAYEDKGDYAKALELFEAYLQKYGSDEKIEREVTFLKSRQGSQPDGA